MLVAVEAARMWDFVHPALLLRICTWCLIALSHSDVIGILTLVP
jgi:hypothetical protein